MSDLTIRQIQELQYVAEKEIIAILKKLEEKSGLQTTEVKVHYNKISGNAYPERFEIADLRIHLDWPKL
jgi:hypothetical protein